MTTAHVNTVDRKAAFIREIIAIGRYQDMDEVIQARVLLREKRIAQEQQQKTKPREKLDKAFSGKVVDGTFEDIWKDVEARYFNENA